MPRLPFNVRVVTPDKSWLVSLKVKEATPYTHGLYYGKLATLDLLIPLGAISGPSSQLTLWQIPLLLLQSHQFGHTIVALETNLCHFLCFFRFWKCMTFITKPLNDGPVVKVLWSVRMTSQNNPKDFWLYLSQLMVHIF